MSNQDLEVRQMLSLILKEMAPATESKDPIESLVAKLELLEKMHAWVEALKYLVRLRVPDAHENTTGNIQLMLQLYKQYPTDPDAAAKKYALLQFGYKESTLMVLDENHPSFVDLHFWRLDFYSEVKKRTDGDLLGDLCCPAIDYYFTHNLTPEQAVTAYLKLAVEQSTCDCGKACQHPRHL